MFSRANRLSGAVAAAALLLASCGGGGGGGGGGTPTPTPTPAAPDNPTPAPTSGFQVPAAVNLTVADIQRIIAQGVAEARARGFNAGIVVNDRVGNVLAVYVMNGTDLSLRIPAAPNGNNSDLQGRSFPASTGAGLLGGISKAIASSYFSSIGGAFSTRTVNDIVWQNFPPGLGDGKLESGPLFSVQFSQLPCSDVSARFPARASTHRGPLGAGADPGSFSLYKNGSVVGSVAVIGDGVYGFDTNYSDTDADTREEGVALAATVGFRPAEEIKANRIFVDGTSLRYSDATPQDFKSDPASAPSYASITPSVGQLVSVRGYFDAAGGILPGTVYGSEESGVRPAKASDGYNDPDIWVVSDGAGNTRYLPKAGTDAAVVGAPLTANEVRTILVEAFDVQRRARAQVRRPLDSRAQNTIAIVDTYGEILGMVRGPDALVDAIDAVPQKARTTAFFSNAAAAFDLQNNTNADPAIRAQIAAYVDAFRTFLGDPTALTGKTAFSVRAVGTLARPYFPDGQAGTPPGPLSIPIERFNLFSTGLQSTLITPDILAHINWVAGAAPADVPRTCSGSPLVSTSPELGVGGNPAIPINRINNGLTLFAGGTPIYRGGQLVGAVAASGDGDDQSDMIAFLGLYNASVKLGNSITVPPKSIRPDLLTPLGQRLPFITCPFSPFVGTNDQNVCTGL